MIASTSHTFKIISIYEDSSNGFSLGKLTSRRVSILGGPEAFQAAWRNFCASSESRLH